MSSDFKQPFRLGSWLVEPDLNRLSRGDVVRHLEPKTMQVLNCLCDQSGDVVSTDKIIEEVWDNRPMGNNPVYKSIAKLRRALDDGNGKEEYIQTVSKNGYRIVATVDMRIPAQPAKPGAAPAAKLSKFVLPILIGIVVGVTSAVVLLRQSTSTPPTLTGISTFPGSHRQPSFAPDGERFAFMNEVAGATHVWSLDPGQTSPTQLTFGDSNDRRPRWSPSGETILFERRNSIWSILAVGGEPVEVIRNAYNPNWSRDGEKIVFERRFEIWIADADGGRQDRIDISPKRELPLAPRWPAFSPDGNEIVFFNAETSPMGDLWSIGTDSSGLRQLTFATSFGGTPVWSPDGESIVYWSERNGNRNLWKVNVDDLTESVFVAGSGNDEHPDFSADGARLVYSNRSERFTLLLSNLVDGTEKVLFESRLQLIGPELSSDGEMLAFFGGSRSGGMQIFTLPISGGDPIEVTSDPRAIHALPHWSGNKKSLYFYYTEREDHFGVVDITDGRKSIVASGWNWDIANGAKVDPAGNQVIYSRLSGRTPAQTLIRDIASGEDRSFYATLEYPRWSVDGSEIAGALHTDQRFPGDVAICPVAGSECRVLAEGGRIPVWSVDNSLLYFVRGYGTSQELFFIPVDGSAPERIVMKMQPLSVLGPFYQVTSDGQIVWVRHSRGNAELWVAEL